MASALIPHVAHNEEELFLHRLQKLSCLVTDELASMIVSRASLFVRMTDRVASQHLRKMPSTPETPIPSMISLVSRNGTWHTWCVCAALKSTTNFVRKNSSHRTVQVSPPALFQIETTACRGRVYVQNIKV